MQDNTIALEAVAALAHHLGNTLIKGVTEGDVGDYATLEESPGTNTLGAVNDLVGDNKVTGLDLLLQTANGGEGNDAADTDGAQGGNVSAGGNLVGSNLVVQAMAAQEGDGDSLAVVLALVVQDGDGRRGGTPRSRDSQRGHLGEAR